MKLKTLSVLIACLFAGAAVAQSQTAPSDPSAGASQTPSSGMGSSFEALDKNGDGVISKDEAKKDRTLSKQWKQLDVDKDGKLSRSEFEASAAGIGSPGTSGSGPSGAPGSSDSPSKKY